MTRRSRKGFVYPVSAVLLRLEGAFDGEQTTNKKETLMSLETGTQRPSARRAFARGRGPAVIVACLTLLAISAGSLGAADLKIGLKADTGKYAARCNNCIPNESYPDNVAVHGTDLSKQYVQWYIQKLDNGNYALKSVDSGKYAARCNNCIPDASYPDSVFVHVTDPGPAYAQWVLTRLANGKYALRSADSGKYFARCNGCAPGSSYPDNVFVHLKDPSGAPYAQWEIILLP